MDIAINHDSIPRLGTCTHHKEKPKGDKHYPTNLQPLWTALLPLLSFVSLGWIGPNSVHGAAMACDLSYGLSGAHDLCQKKNKKTKKTKIMSQLEAHTHRGPCLTTAAQLTAVAGIVLSNPPHCDPSSGIFISSSPSSSSSPSFSSFCLQQSQVLCASCTHSRFACVIARLLLPRDYAAMATHFNVMLSH